MARIDCSDTVNFLKELVRMCNTRVCKECPVNGWAREHNASCGYYISQYPETAVEIVQKWSDEHPVKTRLDDLLEKYPNAQLDKEEGCPDVRPAVLGYCGHCYNCSIPVRTYKNCWNEPIDGGATGKAVE